MARAAGFGGEVRWQARDAARSQSVDLIYDPPFNSNQDYEVFWGETKERRAFEDRHASTQASVEFMRPRCAELVRVLKPTGSLCCHCDWHAVGDMGIDGRTFPIGPVPRPPSEVRERDTAGLGFMDEWYPIQVTRRDRVGRPDIDSFEAAMIRSERKKGFFVAFDYSSDALREVDGFFRRSGKVIIPLTVKEILDEQLAKKLA